MYATIRRYEGVDESRSAEITNKANENLIPRLSELPGFSGYFLFEPANGVLTSISLFDTSSHLDESNRVAAKVLQDENLQPVIWGHERHQAIDVTVVDRVDETDHGGDRRKRGSHPADPCR